MNDLVLYNYFRSSTSYRVRIAMHWKNLSFKYEPIHLLQDGGQQNKQEYRQLNPIGGVPTLTHNLNGTRNVISQSMAIIEYLDEVFPQQPLFSKDIFLKNKIRQLCEIINADTHPLQNLKVMQLLEKKFSFNESQKQEWIHHWIESGLKAYEQTVLGIGKHKFSAADSVTAADMFLIPQLFSARRFNVNVQNFPHLLQIEAECLKLNEFQLAHPYKQIDTPAEFQNKT